jgi:hypothetical protein
MVVISEENLKLSVSVLEGGQDIFRGYLTGLMSLLSL